MCLFLCVVLVMCWVGRMFANGLLTVGWLVDVWMAVGGLHTRSLECGCYLCVVVP